MIIDHVGIVVKSIKKSIKTWQTLFGYRQTTEMVINTRQKVKVVFMSKDDSLTVKLLEPTDATSPVFDLSRRGGGLHHLCFKCDDINAELVRFKELNLRILAAPQPGEAFENENIAFFYATQGLNIELIDTDKRAKKID
jgi:methylmalonyl-CoA/ethylmalonyl-CoA epimerase